MAVGPQNQTAVNFQLAAPRVVPATARAHRRLSDKTTRCPFGITIDTAEQDAYDFANHHADSRRSGKRFIVETTRLCLGRHPNSLGDYCPTGFFGRCHAERKSMADAHSTLLGFKVDSEGGDGTSRRQRFERELQNLSNIESAAVVIECSFGKLLREAPEWDLGKATKELNRFRLQQIVIKYQARYPNVAWYFCDDRALAEEVMFRFFEEFYDSHKGK